MALKPKKQEVKSGKPNVVTSCFLCYNNKTDSITAWWHAAKAKKFGFTKRRKSVSIPLSVLKIDVTKVVGYE